MEEYQQDEEGEEREETRGREQERAPIPAPLLEIHFFAWGGISPAFACPGSG